MKISIMGAGFVGHSLGTALVKAGHEVMFSSRTPDSDKMQQLIGELGDNAHAGTVQETLAYSDVVAIAMNWDSIPDMVTSAGDWSGKIVLDMTQGTLSQLAELTGDTARLVKIFNTIGAEHYTDPVFSGQSATMFYCGDDAEAKAIAAQLASDIGFDAIDAGTASNDKHLVNLALFWIQFTIRDGNGRDFAFKLLQK